jgi:enamine deaminase RidA (YjgF/YER057c/UK114 family)
MGAEARLKELGITLPQPATPLANYVGAVRVGNLLFVSGHGPLRTDGKPMAHGKVGREINVEQGYQVARDVGLSLLATTRAQLGSLDKVKRVVKVLGMVNSADDFGDQPKVINGFSDLMVQVFGEGIGKHARSAVGMAALPMGIPVEIEMILEVE